MKQKPGTSKDAADKLVRAWGCDQTILFGAHSNCRRSRGSHADKSPEYIPV